MSRFPFRLLSPSKWKMEIVPEKDADDWNCISDGDHGFIVGFAYNPV